MNDIGFDWDEPSFRRFVALSVSVLRVLSDEQRERLIAGVLAAWCKGCGAAQPEVGVCQCENDE